MQYACLQCRIHDGRPNLTRSFSRRRTRATLLAVHWHAVWAVVCAIDAEALDAQCTHKCAKYQEPAAAALFDISTRVHNTRLSRTAQRREGQLLHQRIYIYIRRGSARRLDALLQASSPLSERDIPAD
ncbi:unnamed protein product [Trichogramma brassicae]|uniref:Uncharacterized protein n=1 Tax=Trichogramma brassicae TaxID=86971 RepID=A0A6H5J9N8_9HYME|nr:unnamed protein product [Trichogramma brassicae]